MVTSLYWLPDWKAGCHCDLVSGDTCGGVLVHLKFFLQHFLCTSRTHFYTLFVKHLLSFVWTFFFCYYLLWVFLCERCIYIFYHMVYNSTMYFDMVLSGKVVLIFFTFWYVLAAHWNDWAVKTGTHKDCKGMVRSSVNRPSSLLLLWKKCTFINYNAIL